jgi:hypothetical protein
MGSQALEAVAQKALDGWRYAHTNESGSELTRVRLINSANKRSESSKEQLWRRACQEHRLVFEAAFLFWNRCEDAVLEQAFQQGPVPCAQSPVQMSEENDIDDVRVFDQ